MSLSPMTVQEYRDLYQEVNTVTDRLKNIERSITARGMYDGRIRSLIEEAKDVLEGCEDLLKAMQVQKKNHIRF